MTRHPRNAALASALLVGSACGASPRGAETDGSAAGHAAGAGLGGRDASLPDGTARIGEQAGGGSSSSGGLGGRAPQGAGAAAGDASDGNAPGLPSLFPEATFDELFPHRTDPACEGTALSYEAFMEAARSWPAFANDGTTSVRLRELAAFLANTSHETTGGWPTAPDGPYAWGLCFTEETGCGDGSCTQYCDGSIVAYPCAPGQTYHGRGPMQLSWNYNYGQAGDALGLELLADPDQVATDGVTGWATALWFWMTPQPPKPSAHDVMVGTWEPSSTDLSAGRLPGFGMTVNIINGGLECGTPDDPRVADRIGFYERYTTIFGVGLGGNVTCESMQSY